MTFPTKPEEATIIEAKIHKLKKQLAHITPKCIAALEEDEKVRAEYEERAPRFAKELIEAEEKRVASEKEELNLQINDAKNELEKVYPSAVSHAAKEQEKNQVQRAIGAMEATGSTTAKHSHHAKPQVMSTAQRDTISEADLNEQAATAIRLQEEANQLFREAEKAASAISEPRGLFKNLSPDDSCKPDLSMFPRAVRPTYSPTLPNRLTMVKPRISVAADRCVKASSPNCFVYRPPRPERQDAGTQAAMEVVTHHSLSRSEALQKAKVASKNAQKERELAFRRESVQRIIPVAAKAVEPK